MPLLALIVARLARETAVGPVFFAAGVGALQALAIPGSTSGRMRWFALTAGAVLVAYALGLLAGFFAYFVIAFPLSLTGLHGDQVATPAFVGAVLAGAVAGGALVGVAQSTQLRARRRWIVRSAIGGPLILAASLAAQYGPTTDLAAQPQAVLAILILGLLGCLGYGMLTATAVAQRSAM